MHGQGQGEEQVHWLEWIHMHSRMTVIRLPARNPTNIKFKLSNILVVSSLVIGLRVLFRLKKINGISIFN